jgi:5-methyltetrahydropteroyltriglutamate--homocysteine methyltransferase
LKAAGASWIQFDEPTLVLDLDSQKLAAFSAAYTELESALSGLNVLIETYFADIPAESYKYVIKSYCANYSFFPNHLLHWQDTNCPFPCRTLTSLSGVTAYGFDLVRGAQTLELVKSSFPAGKYLFAGVVDGRNIWADDLASSLSTLQALEAVVGKGKHLSSGIKLDIITSGNI